MTTPDPTQPPPPIAPLSTPPSSPAATPPSPPPQGETRHERRERRREERRAGHQDGGNGPSSAGLVIGIILVVGGGIVLLGRATDLTLGPSAWPLWLIVPGVAMVVGSFAIPPRGGLGLAIPGAILAMVGSVLLFQASSGSYATWAYAWALVVPTGPGLGMLIYGLAHRDSELARDGLRTTLVGVGLFLAFAFFFEGVLGLSGVEFTNARTVAPIVAIVFGVILVIAAFLPGRRPTST